MIKDIDLDDFNFSKNTKSIQKYPQNKVIFNKNNNNGKLIVKYSRTQQNQNVISNIDLDEFIFEEIIKSVQKKPLIKKEFQSPNT